MKNKLRFIIAIFALLTFSGIVFAQNNEEIEKLSERKIQRPPQAQRTKIPIEDDVKGRRCPLQIQQIITGGLVDSLAPPPDSTYKTPAFLALFGGVAFKDFDDPTVNRAVGHSFVLQNIKPCKTEVCTASLEIRVCNFGTDLWTNDGLSVGTVQNGIFNAWAYSAAIWNRQGTGSGVMNDNSSSTDRRANCKIITIPINAAVLNTMPSLDLYVQDDTAVDYARLTLNY